MMKFSKILFFLVIFSITLISCKTESNSKEKEIISAIDTKEMAINISGMTCEIGCAKTIESKLSKHDGVLDAKVVFNDSIANIKYDASKTNKASLIAFVGGIAGGMYNATEVSGKSCKGEKSCAAKCEKECCKGKEGQTCKGGDKTVNCKDKKSSKENCKMACCEVKEAKSCKKEGCTKACCA